MLLSFLRKLWKFIFSFFYPKPLILQKKTLLQCWEENLDTERQKFLSWYKSADPKDINLNVDPLFTNYETYIEGMRKPNVIEQQWKSRILVEPSLVGGNIIMYYDPYTPGFVYFSDYQLHQMVLLTMALKYVRIFRCADFYVNELDPLIPISPFAAIQRKFESEDTVNIKKSVAVTEDIFLRRKKETDSTTTKTSNDKKQPAVIILNRFIYRGKVNNHSFLQGMKKIRSTLGKHLTYKDFKMAAK